ncbi:serine--tRNA ligase [Neomegalonema sp.]|uniref:serine--tRNA ligase n=1 Tax=Neomegalonema sp. TaxID=2039713 RepID=UPI00262E0E9A|nr:serine--tRNA ligase [Neomegalonema sp.]MDD2867968.1 serine--tRNA ligase [Neomegalonema sp.]
MQDLKALRDDPEAFDRALLRRGASAQSSELLALDSGRRTAIAAAETALAERNAASKAAGAAKGKGDEAEFTRLRDLVNAKKDEIAALEAAARDAEARLKARLETLPNTLLDSVPDGPDETANREARRWGAPRAFDFKPLEHFEIPAARGLDFEAAGRLSGARFTILRGGIARVQRALGQFMLDTHLNEHGLQEIWSPVLVKPETLYGTGQLPKFAEDSFETTTGHWLVPTAEVTLTNLVAGQILEPGVLPLRFCALTQCFRSEAGSAGRDVRGILRQHQFEKVEMVSVTTPEDSLAEQARMTDCAENILKKLELPYRVMELSAGDTGFGAQRTYDLEVWLPGQDMFREISSVSVCGAFQARRMNARFRREVEGRPEFVHTLNGSGLAVGRTLIAVLENGQQADGSVKLPATLSPYLGGATLLTAEGTLG